MKPLSLRKRVAIALLASLASMAWMLALVLVPLLAA